MPGTFYQDGFLWIKSVRSLPGGASELAPEELVATEQEVSDILGI